MMSITSSCRSALTENSYTENSSQEEIIQLVIKNDLQGVRRALESKANVNSKCEQTYSSTYRYKQWSS